MIQGRFKILAQQKAGPECFKMAILAPKIACKAYPGQFVHLRCQEGPEPLLRRPLSFHRIYPDKFEVLYRVVGRGTALLAKKQKGDTIDVIGPLGNGFVFPPTASREPQTAILVAGGMGAAPLFALAEKISPTVVRQIILLGARTKRTVLCAREFKKLSSNVQITTDDGSQGRVGLVTELLTEVLQSTINNKRTGHRPVPTDIYACGPKPMLKETARISAEFGVPAQGALEENMACGIGACLGCAVETRQGYKQVCKDGPVFNLAEIKW